MSGGFRQAPGRGEGHRPACTNNVRKAGHTARPAPCVQCLTEGGRRPPLPFSLSRVRDRDPNGQRRQARRVTSQPTGAGGRIEPGRRKPDTPEISKQLNDGKLIIVYRNGTYGLSAPKAKTRAAHAAAARGRGGVAGVDEPESTAACHMTDFKHIHDDRCAQLPRLPFSFSRDGS
jgi:hypothetical protein